MRKRAAGISFLAFAVVIGCRAESVSLALAPTLRGSTILIAGITSLGDGALICWEVSKDAAMVDGCTPVKHNSYQATASISGWPKGKVTVWAAFMTVLAPQSQPEWVLNRYGRDGTKLTGANVTIHGKLG